jgi:hypothetical protein
VKLTHVGAMNQRITSGRAGSAVVSAGGRAGSARADHATQDGGERNGRLPRSTDDESAPRSADRNARCGQSSRRLNTQLIQALHKLPMLCNRAKLREACEQHEEQLRKVTRTAAKAG